MAGQALDWQRICDEKQASFSQQECGSALAAVATMEDLSASLQMLAAKHSQGTIPSILETLRPGLVHVQSFTDAITSASQYSPTACLIWGSIQAVLQVAFTSSHILEEVVQIMVEVNNELPMFESYIALFPYCSQLQFSLQDLFRDYIDFCLETIKYLRRPQALSFLSSLVSSAPRTSLERTRRKIRDHFQTFKTAAELEHRRRVHYQQQQIAKKLAAYPLGQLVEDVEPTVDPDFPLTTVKMFRNYTFLGREHVIHTMGAFFGAEPLEVHPGPSPLPLTARPGKSPACLVLHGLGGIGKTQTALEYTYLYEHCYDAMFWVEAEHPSTLAATYSTIAESLSSTAEGCVQDAQQLQGRAIKKAMEWLRSTTRKWLIVFDNVEDIQALHAYLPTKTATQGSVIITTQKSNLPPVTDLFKAIALTHLDREQGAELLFKHLERGPNDEDEAETARAISDYLGGLPLALSTIGGYIHESSSSMSDFLLDVQKSSHAWSASAIGSVQQYERTLSSVFEVALRELGPQARNVINILAFLNPDNVPEELFLADETRPPLYKRADLAEVVRTLQRRQLVRRDTSRAEPFLSIHRSVQLNVLLDLSKDYESRSRAFTEAFRLVCRALPYVSPIDVPEPDKWAQFEKCVPQILAMRTHCLWPEPPVGLPEAFAQVLSNMATFMWHAGLMVEGYEALLTAENILHTLGLGETNPLRGNVEQHLAIIASFYGVSRRDEIMSRRRTAQRLRQAYHATIPVNKVTREDEIRLYNVESDMAFGLMQVEDFEESERYIEKCLVKYQAWGTEDEIPFEYLKYNHISSYIRMSQNRPVDAIECASRAAKLGEKCAGIAHPMTQLCRSSLVNHLYLAGETQKALDLSESVLQIRTKVCGEFNHFTLESHAMTGFLLMKLGRMQDAERHFVACLDRRKRTLWNREGLARTQYLYSKVLTELGCADKDKARSLMDEALASRDYYLEHFPQHLKADPDDMVVFDQMVCLWAGRFTGKLAQAQPAPID